MGRRKTKVSNKPLPLKSPKKKAIKKLRSSHSISQSNLLTSLGQLRCD